MQLKDYVIKLLQTGAFWVALLQFKTALIETLLPGYAAQLRPVSETFDRLVLIGASVFTGAVIAQERAMHIAAARIAETMGKNENDERGST